MKKQTPAILLGIACIALAIAYINSSNNVKKLQMELAQQKSPSESDTETDEPSAASLDKANDEVGNELNEQVVSLTPVEQAVEEDQASGRRMMESMARMLENPTMNEMLEASQRGAVGALYTDLIAYLDLNSEETKYFMDLLMHRQMAQVNSAMKMMSGSVSDEEKAALQQEMADSAELVKEEMKKFLNNEDDYAEFEYYEKTMSERMMLSQMDQSLTGTASELSDTTYRELLGVMHDERENFDFSSDLNDEDNMDMSGERFSQDNLQNYAADIQQLNESICLRAKTILTEEQYEAFASSLKTFADLQLSQLEMASQMFGGGE